MASKGCSHAAVTTVVAAKPVAAVKPAVPVNPVVVVNPLVVAVAKAIVNSQVTNSEKHGFCQSGGNRVFLYLTGLPHLENREIPLVN